MTRDQSLSVIVVLATSLSIAFGAGYWSGMLNASKDNYGHNQLENLWWLGTDIVRDDIHGQWNISITLMNLGHSSSTVVNVLIDGRDPNPDIVPPAFGGNVTVSPLPMPIKGILHYEDRPENGTINIIIKYWTEGFSAGRGIEVRLHTSAGFDYPLFVTLP